MTSRDEPADRRERADLSERAGRAVDEPSDEPVDEEAILAEYEAEKPARHLSGGAVARGAGPGRAAVALRTVVGVQPDARPALPAVVPDDRAGHDVPGLPRLGTSAAGARGGRAGQPERPRLAAGRRGGRPVRLYRRGLGRVLPARRRADRARRRYGHARDPADAGGRPAHRRVDHAAGRRGLPRVRRLRPVRPRPVHDGQLRLGAAGRAQRDGPAGHSLACRRTSPPPTSSCSRSTAPS